MKGYNRETGAHYIKASTKAAIATFHQVIAAHKPLRPLTGPTSLTVEVTWPWRKDDRKDIRAKGRAFLTSKPDLDNWVKQLQDELVTWRFLECDQQVCELVVRKFVGDQPGIRVRIEPVEIARSGVDYHSEGVA